MSNPQRDIDESLYSRQLYVMGHEAQRKMAASSVLIIGINGLGVEVAKNIILAGVKSVSLFDSCVATTDDLAAQFYLSEADIGQNRAAVSAPKLAELNPYVGVNLLESYPTVESIVNGAYTVVLLIDSTMEQQLAMSAMCRSANTSLIIGDVRGVFARVFCDFGDNFVCHDSNGEPIASSMVAGVIVNADTGKATVTVLEETRHNLETGDKVALSEIAGMSPLNDKEFIVTVKDGFNIEIDVSDILTELQSCNYDRGGYVNQVKQPVVKSFKPFHESVNQPGELVCDFVKWERSQVLHIAFLALSRYQSQNGGVLPEVGNVQHADAMFDMAVAINTENTTSAAFSVSTETLQEHRNVFIRLALCCRGVINPMCALLGGVLGQEVLKACSGKFMPIHQWFYYDAMEALPEAILPIDQVQPTGSRYDGQIAVFGKEIQDKLCALNIFLIGAGAIGCEMIKNYAMMGVACDPAGAGNVHLTDMDRIEKSNLSRQFLFRSTDINHPKSTTAVRKAVTMNPHLRATAYESKVAPETETIFNDDFYESLNMVCTALDNVEARLYVDQKCLFYHKPMLESGTLGAKGHTQMVVPHITENYGAVRDPPEVSIPVCTLKHFPNQIDHTLQWAREWFEEIYKQTPDDANQYLSNPQYLEFLASQQNLRLDTLTRLRSVMVDEKPKSGDDCVVWARHSFEDLFCNKIKQLLHNFPLDRMTSNNTPFWSGAKVPPTPITFDASDPLHMEFIMATSILRAESFGLVPCVDPAVVQGLLAAVQLEDFRPAGDVKIPENDEEAKAEAEAKRQMTMGIDEKAAELVAALPPVGCNEPAFKMSSFDFDKDVDSHMRVVASVSNLRARNYRIPEADLHKSRGIAGKITPAIATTTALVTGAVCLEMYKLLQNKPVTDFKNTFTNLALPMFTSMEPEPPKSTIAKFSKEGLDEWKWNQWDRIDVTDSSLTVQGLIDWLLEKYNVELSMLSTGVTILFSDFMPRAKSKERLPMTLKQVVEAVTKKTVPNTQKYMIFELIVNDADSGDEVEIPYLRIKLF